MWLSISLYSKQKIIIDWNNYIYFRCMTVGPKSTLTMSACQDKPAMKWKFIFNKPHWA